ncbi:uncharacterized protein EI97DRAFT_314050 [Westerdykella ornata]|uniref:Uncharacterized protein n=1 Tax=Westerdykella ornata TaxID=318751 RepID=A0A6A6JKW8_WESOR|nr:uncharacterized protein EI97DRAFT_314050 [Westerdykella ornata]KAF2277231.1 hypothetical protein EI97DRAFT_314050 [Westerdykella ornata]
MIRHKHLIGSTDACRFCRGSLAGAAAALAATGTPSHQETQAERHFGTESFNIKSHGEALAAARTAYSGPSTDRTVDPCVTEGDSGSAPFTSGPHCTDTANRLDPKLHIPGGFPETPIETPGERGMDTGSYLPGAHRMSNQPGDPLSSQKEATAMPTNPYTSQKIDPRVDSKPSGPQAASTAPFHESELQPGLAQHTSRNQVDHLQENHPHYGPDAGLIGAGAVATGGLHYASQRDPSKPMTATTAQNPTVSSNAQPAQQRQVSGHEVGITRTDKSDVDQIVDKYMEHSISQTHASLDEQRYDPSAQGAHDASYPSHHHHDGDVAIAAGATGAGHDGKRTEHFPPEQSTVHPVQRIGADHDADHHHDRNTALGAVGVGAAGAGLYAASRKPGYDAEQTAPYGRSDQVAMQQQAAPQPIQQHTHQHFYQQSPHPPLPNQTLEQQPYPQRSLYQPSQPPVQQNPINQSSNQQGGNAAFHAAGAGAASTDLYTPPRPSTEKSDLHRRHDSVQYPNEQYQQKGAGEQQQQHYDGRNAALAAVGSGGSSTGSGGKGTPCA